MARPKTFEREAVLAKAMAVFWEKGYEATSMQDLVQAMGINRGSLYDTFQDKRHLFLAAIAHYTDTVIQETVSVLQAPDASRAAIEAHFKGLVERVVDSHCRGCLITNTVLELAARDADVALRLRASLQKVEDGFFRALGRAQDRGEIAPDRNLRALAHYLTTCIQGLRVISQVNPHPDALKQTVALMLRSLD
ncbi:MAG: TetR/AcrR family transcriptional regulator [Leptolyngbya sp. RL_3_1]|nr:TetR/AcrR family transcriptional regulator [Leptolyngbya sp. RL_3_1]